MPESRSTSFELHAPFDLPARPRLAFAETELEAASVLAERERRRIDACVALAPEAAWHFRTASMPYLAVEDGYDPRRLCDLADPAVRQQQEWAARIDDWLQDRIPAFADAAFTPTRLHLYWLKVMFDSIAIRVHTLSWAFARWQPSYVWHAGAPRNDEQFGANLLFARSLYPALLRRLASHLNIAWEPAGGDAADQRLTAPEALWPQVRKWAINSRARVQSFQRRRASAPARAGGIVLSDRYDLAAVWREATRSGVAVESWELLVDNVREGVTDSPEAQLVRQSWPDALDSAGLLDPAIIDGWDFRDFAAARVRFWWDTLIPEQWSAYSATRVRRKTVTPSAVAASVMSDHIERSVFDALRSLGASAYVYQHGGFVGACECPPWDCNDLSLADCELTYGEGTTRYFLDRSSQYPEGRAAAISVGSSRLDAWRRRIRRGRGRSGRAQIVLIPNLIPRNHRYLDAGTMPDVLEGELQTALVDLVREFPRYSFTFKAFPQADQSRTPAVDRARRPGSNCRVETRTSVRELLSRADLAVLSFPSTVLLEALLTDRPLLVLVDPRFVTMRPDALEALERRAHVARSPHEFLEKCRALLSKGDFGPLAEVDDTFLKQYGTHLNDGRSAARALAAIRGGFQRPGRTALSTHVVAV